MKIFYTKQKIENINADLEIYLVEKHKHLAVNTMFLDDKKLYVKIENFNPATITETLATTIRYVSNLDKYKTLKISLHKSNDIYVESLLDGLLLGSYTFDRYKSDTKKTKLQEVLISFTSQKDDKRLHDEIENKIAQCVAINTNINLVREMINSVADDTTPEKMAKWIEQALQDTKIECDIRDHNYIEKELPAFYAISKGSINNPRLVHLKYNKNKGYAKIVLIGKGVTFDTGGISLKPSEHMYDMKLDKAGAVTIFGIIKTIHDLNIPVEIDAILGFSENMISNNAYKPGDILKTRNKKTIEVVNTDAEGRILLADLFEYAQDKIGSIDYIFDYATLSGGVVSAIGQYSAAIIGHNQKLKSKMIKIASEVDEWYVDLPFNRYFFIDSYKSEIADFVNTPTSSIGGGVILGGVFIDNFVKKEYKNKWFHIDITGVSFIKNNWKYHEYGATGFGIKSGIRLIEKLS